MLAHSHTAPLGKALGCESSHADGKPRSRARTSHGRPSGDSIASSTGLKGEEAQIAAGVRQADNIKVAVRVRPLNEREVSKGSKEGVFVATTSEGLFLVVFNPHSTAINSEIEARYGIRRAQHHDQTVVPRVVADKIDDGACYFINVYSQDFKSGTGKDGTHVQARSDDQKEQTFHFHCCMGPSTDQATVFEGCGGSQLMDAALAGYHVTIFAYGQTGSGKTHTMFGREDILATEGYEGDRHDGLTTRCMRYLFDCIAQSDSSQRVGVKASYLEVYNEAVYDLLHITSKQLPVKWDAERGFWVPGLKIVDCASFSRIAQVIHTGMRNRRTGAHALNHESSRSHAMLTVHVESVCTDASVVDYGQSRFGKISFVDLAGSERVKDTGAAGDTLKEANSINKSLFTLGKVIATLSEAGNKLNVHVPYRDSKLTKLLMDSIGGSALALMVACVTPSDTFLEESLNTLSYATRAKRIQNRPCVQFDPNQGLVTALRKELELLRNENEYLRSIVFAQHEQLRQRTPLTIDPSAGLTAPSPHFTLPAPGPGPPTLDETSTTPLPQLPSAQAGSSPRQPHAANAGNSASNSPRAAAAAAQNRTPEPSAGGLQAALSPTRAQRNPSGLLTTAATLPGTVATGPSPAASSPKGTKPSPRNLAPLDSAKHSPSASLTGPTDLQIALRNGSRPSSKDSSTPKRVPSRLGSAQAQADSVKRLQQTQMLLAQFSEANSQLATENDKLRTGRQMLARDHAEVLNEIEYLRTRLIAMEASANALVPAIAEPSAEAPSHVPGMAANSINDSQAVGIGQDRASSAEMRQLEQQLEELKSDRPAGREARRVASSTSIPSLEDGISLPDSPSRSYAKIHKTRRPSFLQTGKSEGSVKVHSARMDLLMDDSPTAPDALHMSVNKAAVRT